MARRKPTFSIQEDPKLLKELREIAARERISVAALYRRAMDSYLPFLRNVPSKEVFPNDAAAREIAA